MENYMTDQVEATQPEPQAQPTTLTLSDLTLVLQTIATVQSRGAFKAEEMSIVGNLYDKLFKFLEAQGAITKPAPPAPAQEPQGE